jgi:CubicO group peptidase (beta-lactamase class C family)
MVVNQNGKRIATVSAGSQRPDEDIPVNEKTLFRYASLTKPVTGVAALIAEEQGLLCLEDDICDYIPEFKDIMIGKPQDGKVVPDRKPSAKIKLSYFLAHCSGFLSQDELYDPQIKQMPREAFKTIKTHTDYTINNVYLSFEPLSKAVYSTYAYDIIARIIEEKSGMDYADFLNKYLFTPLGIRDMTFSPTEEQWSRLISVGNNNEKNEFQVLDIGRHTFTDHPLTFSAAGAGLCGTAADYNIFMEMLVNKGTYNGVRVLKESSVEKLKTRICENWGLGVNVRDNTTPLHENAYGWSGAYGAHFWVDDENGITALMLKNHRALTDDFWGESINKFEKSVMNSFDL